jgi:hypothetical protein
MFSNSRQMSGFVIQKREVRIPRNSRNHKLFLKCCKNSSYSLFFVGVVKNVVS